MRCIIPCAGFGTRMNMKPNESKELLNFGGKPLIDNALDLCYLMNIEPLVITRIEKRDLISHCIQNNISYQIIETEGKEWPDTILKSKDHWHDNNILILPDTMYDPDIETISTIKKCLILGNNAVLALHNVQDLTKWGMISDYSITEKPYDNKPGFAWGLIGFKKDYGEKLFEAMKVRGAPFKLENCSFTFLKRFEDVTRGNNNEK